VAAVVNLYIDKRHLYIKGEIINKKYKNIEYTKYKANIQNKKTNIKKLYIKIILTNIKRKKNICAVRRLYIAVHITGLLDVAVKLQNCVLCPRCVSRSGAG